MEQNEKHYFLSFSVFSKKVLNEDTALRPPLETGPMFLCGYLSNVKVSPTVCKYLIVAKVAPSCSVIVNSLIPKIQNTNSPSLTHTFLTDKVGRNC